jgi:hypothetical protein
VHVSSSCVLEEVGVAIVDRVNELLMRRLDRVTRTDVMIFQIFSPRQYGENIGFCHSEYCLFLQNFNHDLGF